MWKIKTSTAFDMVFMICGIILITNGHWQIAMAMVAWHILFAYPKEPGGWMK